MLVYSQESQKELELTVTAFQLATIYPAMPSGGLTQDFSFLAGDDSCAELRAQGMYCRVYVGSFLQSYLRCK